jgi:hypothetical protein
MVFTPTMRETFMKLHPALTTNPKSSRKGAWLLSLVAALALSAAMPATSRASIVLTVQSVASTAGAFDVELTNTGPSAVSIDAFAFEISVNNAQVHLNQANISTTVAPYIFDGQSLFGPIISTTSGGTVLDASDAYAISNSDVTIGSGVTLGLGHVLFSITGTLTSPATVSFNQNSTITNLADKGNNVAINSFVNGTITPPTTVPEPSTLVMASLMIGISGTACLARRFRRKSA